MKLSDWARKKQIDYKTAYRLFRSGRFPRPVEQLATGTILVHEPEPSHIAPAVALYARVSSHDQKTDLERQMQRLRDFASANGLPVKREVTEVGSGLNGHRKKLRAILADPNITVIVVEHRDRLARFGSEYIESALKASGRTVMVANETEYKDDMVQDMVDVLTCFCARMYGRRSAKNRAERALKAVEG
ncbi:MAG: IS607 family transposase [Methanomassiliicoccales archaeon]